MEIRSLLQSLTNVRQAWALSPRANGGVWALAGFEFQLSKALVRLIERVDADPDLDAPRIFVEALSDLVDIDNGLVIAQAKRTLSSGAIASALEELWAIDQLVRTAAPEIHREVRYEIHSARRSIVNAEASKGRWPAPLGAAAAEVAKFKARVTFEVRPDPRLEAAKLLLDRFKDPSALNNVTRYLGLLLAAAASKDFDTATVSIQQEIRQLRVDASNRERRLGLWGAADQPPASVQFEPDIARAVRIGERLTPLDLREGRLAPRRVYEELIDVAESHLAAPGTTGRIPTLWIEGRSGAGKSAALLHVTSRLYDQDPSRVILWLGAHTEWLGNAARWATDLVRQGRQVIFALDDPCSAERQHKFQAGIQEVYDEWQAAQAAGSGADGDDLAPPMILCCGPAEQRQTAEASDGSELDLVPLPLPRETPEDLEELASWYEARTGKPALSYEGDVLLVQRFFEWNNGRLQAFAARFKARLADFDRHRSGEPVLSLVSAILALGRLYADFPASALRAALKQDPDTEAAFIQLSQEESHFSFEPTSGSGVRLTHPHLAEAIYREWYRRPADKPRRRDHLRLCLKGTLDIAEPDPSLRLAPLWAISRVVQTLRNGGDDDLQSRLDLVKPELTEVLREIYPKDVAGTRALSELPVWVGLGKPLDLRLEPPPARLLTEAVRSVGAPERGLRLSAHKLLQQEVSEDAPEARAVVKDMLVRLVDWRDEHGPWSDWPWLAVDYINRLGAEGLRPALLRVIERAGDWTSISHVMEAILRRRTGPDDLALVVAWLRNAQARSALWPRVLQLYLEAAEDVSSVRDLILRCLEVQPGHPYWPQLWQSALGQMVDERPRLLSMGRAWLGLAEESDVYFSPLSRENPNFDRVWSGLWENSADEKERLTEFGRKWLDEVSPTNFGWSRIWQQLWLAAAADTPARQGLQTTGVSWLQQQPQAAGWSYVWEALAKASDGDSREEISRIGQAWLEDGNQAHQGWGFVWELEHTRAQGDDAQQERLVKLAEQWLSNPWAQRTGWVHQWIVLSDQALLPRTTLHQLAIAWLESTTDGSGWSRIYTECDDCDDPRLIDLGRRQLSSGEQQGWNYLFDSWLARSGDKTGALSMIMSWLERSTGSEQNWATLWGNGLALAGLGPEGSQLIDMSNAWVPHHLDHPAWSFVYRRTLKVADDRPTEADVQLGLRWLLQTPPTAAGWGSVWTPVVNNLKAIPDELVEPTHAWLRGTEANNGSWLGVCRNFQKRAPTKVRLGELRPVIERRMLENAGASSEWFGFWRFRMDLAPNWLEDPALIASAIGWIRSDEPAGNLVVFVFAGLNKSADPEVRLDARAAVVSWLSNTERLTPERLGVARSLARFTRNVADAAALLDDLVVELASANPPSKEWTGAWLTASKLPLSQEDRSRLEQAGVIRLAARDDEADWVEDFRIFSSRADAKIAAETGLRWLKAHSPCQAGWMTVWETLRQASQGKDRDELHRLLSERLTAGETPAAGTFDVWRYSARQGNMPVALKQLACRWLILAEPDWPEWVDTWRLLRKKGPDLLSGLDAKSAQDNWLRANPANLQWSDVLLFRTIQSADLLDDPEIRQAAGRWLDAAAPEDRHWSRVAGKAAVSATPTDGPLIATINGWLADSYAPFGWPFVWVAMWRHNSKTETARTEAGRLARAWLAQASADAQGRHLVVARLKKLDNKKPRSLPRG